MSSICQISTTLANCNAYNGCNYHGVQPITSWNGRYPCMKYENSRQRVSFKAQTLGGFASTQLWPFLTSTWWFMPVHTGSWRHSNGYWRLLVWPTLPYNTESVFRVANRPGVAGIVPELTHGVPCPGRGSFCPGNVKINHRAWIYGCSLMNVLYFILCLSVTHDLTWLECDVTD